MELSPDQTLHGFTVLTKEALPEVNGDAYVLTHDESKARLLYLANDDNNKAFAIGFRTPPQDDTGVFHILEHSVLCGSRKFPVKEPFVDLLKGSMQTFLNAMTFPDKTLYPVASTNEQDLSNLMDVYLDAVFHPRIYNKRAIFEQEGWHYELTAKNPEIEEANKAMVPLLSPADTTLSYNGVVFNEMKGALSDASSVLYNELQFALFPDTPYAFESGGTPEAIPTLTYENYLDDHRRHYNLANSYTVLYGNLDIDRALGFLNDEYFAPVAAEEAAAQAERAAAGAEPLVPRELAIAPATTNLGIVKTMDTALENACAGAAYVVGTAHDRTRIIATDILIDALFGSNEAPMKRALLDANIAEDISAYLADGLMQPFAVITMRKPTVEDPATRLTEEVEKNLRALIDAGFDKEVIEASLSHAEFIMREHDFGYADGVALAATCLSGWLYDDAAATDFLRYEDAFAELRAALDTDFFEQLATSLFLENDHRASAEVKPTPGQTDNDQSAELAGKNFSLSSDERKQIVEEEMQLRELQMKQDSPEDIATLPRLTLADLSDAPAAPTHTLNESTPVTCLRHDIATRGITYVYRYFDASALTFEDLPYASILALVLGKLGTAHHTASELDTLTQGRLGNLSFFVDIYDDDDDPAVITTKFVASSSALSENTAWLATLPREVLLETDFSDLSKIKDILLQRKIGLEQAFANAGHGHAITRLESYYKASGIVREQLENIDFYRFLRDLVDHFDERGEALSVRLAEVAARLFADDTCIISFTGSDEDYAAFWQASPELGRTGGTTGALVIPEATVKNEAFVVPTDISYTAQGFDRRLVGADFTGAWTVAARALSLDYLWNEVRVKGGAYGVGFGAVRSGSMRFYTYRDPHIDESLARFASSVDWLRNFDPSEEDLVGFVVSSVASFDEPKKARQAIRREDQYYFTKREPAERERLRTEMIESSVEGIRGLADTLGAIVDAHAICSFGNSDILVKSKSELNLINLLNE